MAWFVGGANRLPRLLRLPRVARVLRLLGTVDRFRVIFQTFRALLPRFGTLFMMLGSLYWFYAAVGVEVFGGLVKLNNTVYQVDTSSAAWINAGKPLLHAAHPDKWATRDGGVLLQWASNLNGSVTTEQMRNVTCDPAGVCSAPLATSYFGNNFNDFPSGLVVLFELMVVNNWWVIMDGIAASTTCATGANHMSTCTWAKGYFVSFNFIAVLMVMNLVVAFILDGFFEEQAQEKARSAEETARKNQKLDEQRERLAEQARQLNQSFSTGGREESGPRGEQDGLGSPSEALEAMPAIFAGSTLAPTTQKSRGSRRKAFVGDGSGSALVSVERPISLTPRGSTIGEDPFAEAPPPRQRGNTRRTSVAASDLAAFKA